MHTEIAISDHRSMKYFRYFALLAQEMDVRIDEAFLVQLLRTVEIYRSILQAPSEEPANQMCGNVCSTYSSQVYSHTFFFSPPTHSSVFDFQLPELLEQFSAAMIYFEMLVINPFKIRV